MNYKHEVTVLKPVFTADGYGGSEVNYIDYKSIKANTAPAEEKIAATDGSVRIYSLLKVFTKDNIDLDDFRIMYNGQIYKLASKIDYSKVILYQMEKV